MHGYGRVLGLLAPLRGGQTRGLIGGLNSVSAIASHVSDTQLAAAASAIVGGSQVDAAVARGALAAAVQASRVLPTPPPAPPAFPQPPFSQICPYWSPHSFVNDLIPDACQFADR